MGQGKGLSHKSVSSTRGGGGKATQRSVGVSKGSGPVAGKKGAGPRANAARGGVSDQASKHGKVGGPPPVMGSGNFKPGMSKSNPTC